MKVAVIIDTWFPATGGGQINAWEISKRLADKKTEIDIITRNCGEDNLEKVPYLKIYKLGPKTRPDSIISKFYFLINLFFFVLKRNYDLIHVHPFLPALVTKVLSLLKNNRLIITIHGTKLFEKEKKTPSRILEKYILTGLRYDTQISVTRAFLKIPNINKKIVVIPNGIDIKKFTAVNTSKYPYPTILWVGRFDPVKQVEDLIHATENLSAKILNVQLVLVGYGYHEKKLKKLVRQLNLKNVIFEGQKTENELISIYKKSHVFVLPSASEGQPLTILEAQASALPVVATKVGGIPEIVKDGETGLLVPPEDPQSLADAILRVLTGKNSFGQKGYENVKKAYTWDRIAKLTLDLYRKVSS